ncbi:MAG: hypothetical protein JWO27_358 [Frankiales bacterium]|nr:hypothetical protein [Frankiales bacterium]
MTDPHDPFAAPAPGGQPTPPPPVYGAPPAYGAPPPSSPPPYGAPLPYGTPTGPFPGAGGRNGMGVAALVLGIVGATCLFWTVIAPALGVVFGLVGRRRAKRHEATNGGVALTGAILGGFGLLFAAVFYGYLIANSSAVSRYYDCMQAAKGDTVIQQECQDQFRSDLGG